MIVVSDASPIIGLAAVGHLDLLRRLYGRVVIPEAVRDEVRRAPERPGAEAMRAAVWVEVQPCPPSELLEALRAVVDDGEAEALALAVTLAADLVLMDERKGRREAARLGLVPVGVLGVLVEAKGAGLIAAVRPSLEALRERAGFRFDDTLLQRVLAQAGE